MRVDMLAIGGFALAATDHDQALAADVQATGGTMAELQAAASFYDSSGSESTISNKTSLTIPSGP